MPRRNWTAKDERQYKHVRRSELDRGRDESKAEEIAARTVNKQRQREGRTQRRTPGGTGNPNEELGERTVNELRNRAAELRIEGRSSMSKAQLVDAIRRRG